MNLEVFCYLGLLRFPEQLKPALDLIPEEQRAQADALLASAKDLPKAELLRRWSHLRQNEYAAIRRDTHARLGIQLDALPGSIRDACITWVLDQNE